MLPAHNFSTVIPTKLGFFEDKFHIMKHQIRQFLYSRDEIFMQNIFIPSSFGWEIQYPVHHVVIDIRGAIKF